MGIVGFGRKPVRLAFLGQSHFLTNPADLGGKALPW